MVLTYDQFTLYVLLGISLLVVAGIFVKNKVLCSVVTVLTVVLMIGLISVTEWIGAVEPSRFEEVPAETVMTKKDSGIPYVTYTAEGQKRQTSKIKYTRYEKERVEIGYCVVGCGGLRIEQSQAVAYIRYRPVFYQKGGGE